MLSTLKGNFEVSARDGEFVRSAATDATFDYLNSSGDFKVAFPDLDKEAFPYRLVTFKGEIDRARLVNSVITVQSNALTITGVGEFDLRQRIIEAKGLVSVSMSANRVLKNIPLIGSLLGGRLVGIPLRVTGSFDQPEVSYLAPADVGMELVNMPLRILGAPLDAMRLFTPGGKTE